MSPIKKLATEQLLDILEQVLKRIVDDSDVVWTRFDTPAALRAELASYSEQLEKGHFSCLRQLDLLFAPTGSLQEHSISNGWEEEFIRLSALFDSAYASLRHG